MDKAPPRSGQISGQRKGPETATVCNRLGYLLSAISDVRNPLLRHLKGSFWHAAKSGSILELSRPKPERCSVGCYFLHSTEIPRPFPSVTCTKALQMIFMVGGRPTY
jgi:hypothetical protein